MKKNKKDNQDNQKKINPEAKSLFIQKDKIKKPYFGKVVSDKTDKTIIVEVVRYKMHPKYKKSYRISKRYTVHDAKNQFKKGSQVSFIECRPLSKRKKWRVLYN